MSHRTLLLWSSLLLSPTLTDAQTCAYPWTATHEASALFQVGQFYRSPYNEVIEVLAETCVGYDTLLNDDGSETRVCVPGLALRNVQGRPFLTSPKKTVVWINGADVINYASSVIPADRPVGTWGQLPASCYAPSTVVSVQDGAVQVRMR